MEQKKAGRIHLQVALDAGDSASLLRIARQTADTIDWLEAGTPWIMREGMSSVRALKKALPEKTIVADLKIMDAGDYEAGIAFEAGANIVTVLSLASDATIRGAIQAARRAGGEVLVDMLQERDIARRIPQVLKMGAHYIGLHNAYDDLETGKDPLAEIRAFSRLAPGAIVVAGGVGLENIAEIAGHHPRAIIVGRSVTAAKDPAQAAREMREILDAMQMEGDAR
jgi:3-hexulose-6-phosphate synthase